MASTTGAPAEIKDSILDTIGETPLVRLSRLGAGLRAAARREGRVLQPGGSIKDRVAVAHDRGRRARRAAAPGRHDRRADVGQHRHRPGDRRAAEGLPRDRGDAGQDVASEKIDLLRAYGAEVVVCPTDVDPELAGVLLPRRRPADAPRSRAPSSPTSTPTRPTRRRTTAATGPELWRQTGGRITHLVVRRRHRRHDHRRARATCASRTPTIEVDRRRPGRLDLLQRRGQAVPRRGRRRGLLAADLRPVGGRPLRDGLRPRLVPHDAPARARPRGCSSAARAALAVHAALEVAREIDDPEARGRGDPARRRPRRTCRRSSTTPG